eukprot:COSAG02_NODE_47963_length_337_cov_0.915966_1_plen_24_part_01
MLTRIIWVLTAWGSRADKVAWSRV